MREKLINKVNLYYNFWLNQRNKYQLSQKESEVYKKIYPMRSKFVKDTILFDKMLKEPQINKIDKEIYGKLLKLRRKYVEITYGPSIDMLQYLQNICKIEQPGALNKTYFYQFDKTKKYRFTKILNHIYLILNNFFGTFNGLISKPTYLFTQNKLIIFINYHIPYLPWYKSKKLTIRNLWKYNKKPANSALDLKFELNKLVVLLSNLMKINHLNYLSFNNIAKNINNLYKGPTVELQLNYLVYPYHDSNILAKFIALNSNKKKFRRIFNTIIKNVPIITKGIIKNNNYKHAFIAQTNGKKIEIHSSIPAILTGLKVKISGRLITQRQIPKRTIEQKEIGAFKRTRDSIVDYAMYTNKNKKGAYTVKVWTTSKITCIKQD